ncbi:MAG: MoxR family ATPase [Armatimonadota bacterium]|nr:MoxR family ATPase [Armatimonadota bacterium]
MNISTEEPVVFEKTVALTAEEAAHAREQARLIIAQIERVIIGKRDIIEMVIIALLARGHVLIEDIPGVGKTMLAKAMARAMSGVFKRIQFTPDLLPGDVTGLTIYHQKTDEFIFTPGPIFANVVLADEINRATPKTQSALLEAMEELQVTLEGVTRILPRPFFVIATQNPVEYRGTYPLPEAQMDRFLVRVHMGYPQAAEEVELLARHADAGSDEGHQIASGQFTTDQSTDGQSADGQASGQVSGQSSALLERVEPVLNIEAAHRLQLDRARVHVSRPIQEYIVAITRATRSHPHVTLGASPRGALALQRAAQSAAIIAGREYVTPDDVKRLSSTVLSHRLILRGEVETSGIGTGAATVIQHLLDEMPVP